MKAMMISCHAKWCVKIMNGEKTVEVRTSKALAKATQKLINEYGFAEFYVCCSKDHSLIYTDGTDGKGDYVDFKYYESYKGDKNDIGSGKVLFKFRCYKVEEHKDFACMFPYSKLRYNKATCLSEEDLEDYGFVEGKGYVPLYAIHISDLEIFDKPKELSEFYKDGAWKVYEEQFDSSYIKRTEQEIMKSLNQTLTKAPQNFAYLEVE